MFRAIRVRIGPCFTATVRIILGCLCNLYVGTSLPKYAIVLYLDCIVNVSISHQDS
jgi:hypothetical protein